MVPSSSAFHGPFFQSSLIIKSFCLIIWCCHENPIIRNTDNNFSAFSLFLSLPEACLGLPCIPLDGLSMTQIATVIQNLEWLLGSSIHPQPQHYPTGAMLAFILHFTLVGQAIQHVHPIFAKSANYALASMWKDHSMRQLRSFRLVCNLHCLLNFFWLFTQSGTPACTAFDTHGQSHHLIISYFEPQYAPHSVNFQTFGSTPLLSIHDTLSQWLNQIETTYHQNPSVSLGSTRPPFQFFRHEKIPT